MQIVLKVFKGLFKSFKSVFSILQTVFKAICKYFYFILFNVVNYFNDHNLVFNM